MFAPASFAQRMVNLFLPAQCLSCRCSTSRVAHLCEVCEETLSALNCIAPQVSNKGSIHTLIAGCEYQFPIDQFILRLKFKNHLNDLLPLTSLLEKKLRAYYSAHPLWPEAILAVPLHPQRLRERGFNQAHEIAKRLAKRFDLPLLSNALKRTVATPQQSTLSRHARRKNLKGAFNLTETIPYTHLALVDDVCTTGSTLREIAHVIKQHHPTCRLDAWVCAQVL